MSIYFIRQNYDVGWRSNMIKIIFKIKISFLYLCSFLYSMMFSNSSKYAIKSVLFLAINSTENKKIMVKDISIPINVPKAYIAKLLQELAKKNMISSVRGPKGGFYLNEENLNRTVLDVVRVIDGEKKLNACMLSLKKCNEEKPCPLHNILSESRNKILKNLKNKRIKDLAYEVTLGNSFLPL
ncbi:Rrf2 family transcriptional regulator [Sabulilitoribacter multivorans]|uniref:Rrf2 family transcriptional regulator n=1 Tax=Flaviramulus multivorans TaxID=1304750 RepID=A0ABS9IEW8_9FLAO|nr:Rrf2 family transcriptional regulator [Flaviramulus multivorans]MCF7559324.1 Rrf2 family transcriptional regulator [Flaviramulus multivorans]